MATSNTLPTLKISFEAAAQAVANRSKKGYVALLLRDAEAQGLHVLTGETLIPSALGEENKAVIRSALQGMGNTGIPMVSGIAELVMRIGSALLLPHVIGEYGIYMAEVLAWAGATALLVICYFRTERRFPKEGESQHLLD